MSNPENLEPPVFALDTRDFELQDIIESEIERSRLVFAGLQLLACRLQSAWSGKNWALYQFPSNEGRTHVFIEPADHNMSDNKRIIVNTGVHLLEDPRAEAVEITDYVLSTRESRVVSRTSQSVRKGRHWPLSSTVGPVLDLQTDNLFERVDVGYDPPAIPTFQPATATKWQRLWSRALRRNDPPVREPGELMRQIDCLDDAERLLYLFKGLSPHMLIDVKKHFLHHGKVAQRGA